MSKRKKIRTRGKLSFSRYFQKFEEGNSVAVVAEPAVANNFPKRLQGQTGVVLGNVGRSYSISIKKKKYLIEPIHLKRIKQNDNKK